MFAKQIIYSFCIILICFSIHSQAIIPGFTAGFTYLTTKVHVKNIYTYQGDAFVFAKNQFILQIRRINYAIDGLGTSNTIGASKSFTFDIQFFNPQINFYKSMFSIEENNKRVLIYMKNLTLFAQYTSNIMFQGVFCQRNQLFYKNNINNTDPVIYYDLQTINPRKMEVYIQSQYQTQHRLAWGQTKLITFFKNASFIQIRDTHLRNISQSFNTFQTIYLINSGYQCYSLNIHDDSYLVILDNTGLLLEIDLRNNSIVNQNHINLYGQTQLNYQDITLLIFNRYTLDSYNRKIGRYRSMFNKITLSFSVFQRFSSTKQQLYNQKVTTITNQYIYYPYEITIVSRMRYDSCVRNGVYSNGAPIQIRQCLPCPQYCLLCTNPNSCNSCSVGHILNVTNNQCSMYPQCQIKQFLSNLTFTCINCSKNCLQCTGINNCILCQSGYYLDSTYCNISISSSRNQVLEQIKINITHDVVQGLFNSTYPRLINKIPLNRQILRVIMLFFPNIDDFWLYIYHQRNYTQAFTEFLQIISILEQQKWNPLQIFNQSYVSQIDQKVEQFQQKFDTRKHYSKSKYVKQEQKGETLLTKCLYFLTVNILCSLMILAFLKGIFHFVSKYRISKLLRKFSFWGYFGILLIDGNIQIIYFLMFSQSQLMFSFDFNDKIMHIIEQLIFFIYLLYTVSCYMLYYSFYKKLSTYFVDNTLPTIDGILVLTINCAFRQLCLSAIHNFLRQDPSLQNLMLIVVQVLYIAFNIGFSYMRLKFKEMFVIWIFLIFSFLRILFNFISYLQFKYSTQGKIIQQFDALVQLVLFTYIALYWLSTLIYTFISFIISVISIIQNYILGKKSNKKSKESKGILKKSVKINEDHSKKILTDKSKSKNQIKNDELKKSINTQKPENLKKPIKVYNFPISKFKSKKQLRAEQLQTQQRLQNSLNVSQNKHQFKAQSFDQENLHYENQIRLHIRPHENANKVSCKLSQSFLNKNIFDSQDFHRYFNEHPDNFDYFQHFSSRRNQRQKEHDMMVDNFNFVMHKDDDEYKENQRQTIRSKLSKKDEPKNDRSLSTKSHLKIKTPRQYRINKSRMLIREIHQS